jgi:hypothetical protein
LCALHQNQALLQERDEITSFRGQKQKTYVFLEFCPFILIDFIFFDCFFGISFSKIWYSVSGRYQLRMESPPVRKGKVAPIEEVSVLLPGEVGLASLTDYFPSPTRKDWSLVAKEFRRVFAGAFDVPQDIVRAIVERLDETDVLSLAGVSRDGLVLAKGLARCLLRAKLEDVSAILTGREALFECSDFCNNHIVILRDGTALLWCSNTQRASMGKWSYGVSLAGRWKKCNDAQPVIDFRRFWSKISLHFTEWQGRATEEWYAMSEHALPQAWDAARNAGMDLTSTIQHRYMRGIADGNSTYILRLSGIVTKKDGALTVASVLEPSESGAPSPFSYWEKAQEVERKHKWLQDWKSSNLLLSPTGTLQQNKSIFGKLVERRSRKQPGEKE